ncbi:MAG: bifunctional YncE family protein/alkaline phosphatase family protein, partial [Blastocatellia bacterium]
ASDGRVYVSAWGNRTISTFRTRHDGSLIYTGRINVGPHPSALLTNSSGSRLFAALGPVDQIAVVDTRTRRVLRYLSDAAPGGPSEGSTPNALALSKDESKLYVAEGDNNAVAIFDMSSEKLGRQAPGPKDRLLGRVPADWYPTAVLEAGNQLLVLNGKGHGSHANPDGPTPGQGLDRPLGYDLGQLNGTLRLCSNNLTQAVLAPYSDRVAAANGWDHPRSIRHYPPFRHVVYIIKENRTYDQVLGDLKEGDGDPDLVFFGNQVSPNHHALALRFGLFDRFFTNAEVSSQGHIWSTAGYVTDYGEKTIPSMYSDRRADVDGEEIDEPTAGFLWTLATRKGVTFRDYGEMVNGPQGWPVTQHELGPDICPTYPPFNFEIPDQVRADAWIAELNQFAKDGEMPALEVMHLPSDHTAGGRAGLGTPRAYMADNDLALGRIVEALSKSPFWKDTVVFVLEDDSQAGPDHVDSHRSPFFAISAYSRPGVIHR